MNVIKRSGEEVQFDISKIENAIRKANAATSRDQMGEEEITAISRAVEAACATLKRASSVEEIQDMVEKEIMSHGYFSVAKNYITYRYERALVRKGQLHRPADHESAGAQQRRSEAGEFPTRTRWSTACSGTIWQAKRPRTLRNAFFCLRM